MARFLTTAELYARSGGAERVLRLAPPESGGSSPAESVATAITAAEEEAVSYLTSRYPTQLPTTPTTTPEILKSKLALAAIYHLARSGRDLVSDNIRRDYEDTLSWYRAVVSSRANLDLDPVVAVDRSAPQILANKSVDDLIFGNGGLDEW